MAVKEDKIMPDEGPYKIPREKGDVVSQVGKYLIIVSFIIYVAIQLFYK